MSASWNLRIDVVLTGYICSIPRLGVDWRQMEEEGSNYAIRRIGAYEYDIERLPRCRNRTRSGYRLVEESSQGVDGR